MSEPEIAGQPIVAVEATRVTAFPTGSMVRPRLPAERKLQANLPVTDEMMTVGFKVGMSMQPRSPLLVETLAAIYRAMAAVAPEPEAPLQRAELHFAKCNLFALEGENAQLKARPECPTLYDIGWGEYRAVTQDDVDSWQKALREMSDQRSGALGIMQNVIAAKDARIAELDSELATLRTAFTAANVAPTPEPEHNPFRDFPSDRRRMGPG